MRNIALASGGM